jgi:hypothetical protein
MTMTDDPPVVLEEGDLFAAVRESCTFRAPATIFLKDTGVVCKARFASHVVTTITFDVSDELETAHLGQVCAISFAHGEKPLLFLTTVVDYCERQPGRPAQLVVSLPSVIVGVEKRGTFRVRVVDPAHGLDLEVTTEDGKTWSPRLVDLSLTGMQIAFPTREPELTVYSRVNVLLRLKKTDLCCQLRGVVRRRDGKRYGLFFPEAVRGGEICPPEALRKLVEAVEQLWMDDDLGPRGATRE